MGDRSMKKLPCNPPCNFFWNSPNVLEFNLQPSWEERTHADGRVFYINHSKYIYRIS
jgi:hypothetical protein